ncbi:hypothetical protein [Butyrivibrio sp. VCD2006]|uniref:hypothetical protein n=1 Tax=Butyrivibrio sp. VCD2006 TaxID=1280664 RepID=UPI0003FCAAD4|nr:hypothetical protein [Butyrivibrio sp. VCD2006]
MRKYKEIYDLDIDGFNESEEDDFVKYAIKKAVTKAIDECIDEDILKEFFLKYREEVIEMGVLEYSAERHIKVIENEFYSMGAEDKEKELKPIIKTLSDENVTLKSEKSALTDKNVTLKSEKSALTDENVTLKSEKSALTDENVTLKSEKSALTDEISRLTKLLEENGINQ